MAISAAFMLHDADFLAAIESLAVSEANKAARVIALLTGRQANNPGNPQIFLPREFLIAVGLAVRLTSWERNQLSFHTEAGLPSGAELLLIAIRLRSGRELAGIAARTSSSSLQLFYTSFIWAAQTELNASIGIRNDLSVDQLDLIADFLWDNRHLRLKRETQE